MPRPRTLGAVALAGFALGASAERFNHEGRLLGPPPTLTAPVLFHTPEADAILASLQISPVDSPWNEDVSRRPPLANSDAMIAQILADLRADRRTLRLFFEMNFVLVPANQRLVPITFRDYPKESDPGPYPLPPTLPIETWPRETGTVTLEEWQRDTYATGGDRHAIAFQPDTGACYETWQTKLVGADWTASNGARFDLASNALRPAGWTSGDAAGLPMFPALVRYDECERGQVEHVMRVVVKRTRKAYLYPARHYASVPVTTDPNVPAMGQRLRLKAGFAIPASWSKHEKAVALGLKKYGALVADNGNFFSISVTPDPRWPADAFRQLSTLSITNFEVIQTTGPAEGPRSPGAPTAAAGPDQTIAWDGGTAVATLHGGVAGGIAPVATHWTLYAGPGAVSLQNGPLVDQVTFPTPGTYTLRLGADDGVHALAWDAVVITVKPGLRLSVSRADSEAVLSWTGGSPPYIVGRCGSFPAPFWEPLLTNNQTSVRVPFSSVARFYRVRSP